jgi:hypothetical protein
VGFFWHRDAGAEPTNDRVRSVAATGSAVIFDNWTLGVPWWAIVLASGIITAHRVRRRTRASSNSVGDSRKPETSA